MSVARFIADQRTMHGVPHAVCCAILAVSVSWFYKWLHREPTPTEIRRRELDAAVKAFFEASKHTYGSPRIHRDLVEAGWTVSVNTVADSMQRQGLQGRKPKRRKGLTRQDTSAPKFPDRLKRDFTAAAPNLKWCGDITYIRTWQGWLYLIVTWNHVVGRLSFPSASPRAEGAVDCVGDLGGEVAGAGPARAGGAVAGDLDRSGSGTAHDRCVCAWLAEFLLVCEREGVDPAVATRGEIALFVKDLRTRPSQRGSNVVALDSGSGLANATLQQRLSVTWNLAAVEIISLR